MGDDVEMSVESQGEQAPGLSGVDVAKVNNPAHTASMTVTAGSRGSSIMDTVRVDHFTTVHSPLKVNVPQCQAHKSIRERTDRLIMIQHRDGRLFIHEHQGGISSWQDQCVQEVLTVTQATITEFDQCLLGLMATDRDGSLKHCRRRSKLVSTMPAIDSIFSGKLCQERHELTLRKEKHMTHGSIHHSCAKPSRQRSNYRRNGAQAVSNYWRPSKQKSHPKET